MAGRFALALLLLAGLRPAAGLAQPVHLAIANPQAGSDGFGSAVASYGDDVLIGDPSASKVYLYDGDTGALLRTFTSPQVDDSFGYSVATVGTNVLVGAPYDDTGGTEWGAAYLFDGATGALLRTIVNPGPSLYGHFGSSVAGSGVDLLIGGSGFYGGAKTAYLYDGSTGSVLQTFDSPTDTWEFGTAIVDVGGLVAVAAPYDPPSGLVYVFDRASGALVQTLQNPDPRNIQNFGWELAALGTNLLVGSSAPYCCSTPSAAHLIDPSTGTLLRTYPIFAPIFSVAPHGGNVLVGTYYSAVLFDAATAVTLRTFAPPGQFAYGNMGVASAGGRVIVSTSESLQDRSGVVYSFCGGPTECGPCETCDATGACVVAPHPTCRAPLSGGSSLVVKDATPNDRDQVLWRASGAFGDLARDNPGTLFGRPDDAGSGHDYSLCMYDESGPTPALVFQATAPAGGSCIGPCWSSVRLSRAGDSAGYSYIDALQTPHGVDRMFMRTTSGTGLRMKVLAKGPNLSSAPLGMATPPFDLPLRVQLQNRLGYCWEATYTTARRNVDGAFRAASKAP
jgi:hypothetical protein